jgi:hypothetical protein
VFCINLDVRLCEDGVLVYNPTTRATHLIPTTVWEFFMAMTEGQMSAKVSGFGRGCALHLDQKEREEMIKALVQAGLLASC